ncbi:uncharacterized protein MONOS_7201 [Monocercomonoides exilis]|uniref:uncharacterized protein n=1 Tax=Monocercomonoides exilis TaxID=2049356 RepID=UPI003559B75D|nr:hypothetical protein MONOS_7201 [Monocercomonoides exilis]|eukprot:MONOS_7201.1-p1 / transcript=MONOS_7201.1 / gene=MONOS_7201 / organism=Monocercomonoides_exilis_PA203 / gene_product=unspecified product / transcript_product=unspecified product / location=Mono_scaffold00240:75620-75913(-) / protein_length=79 / sequence_SO=supercontig / SO=protein_coding / is_pseudo=false
MVASYTSEAEMEDIERQLGCMSGTCCYRCNCSCSCGCCRRCGDMLWRCFQFRWYRSFRRLQRWWTRSRGASGSLQRQM